MIVSNLALNFSLDRMAGIDFTTQYIKGDNSLVKIAINPKKSGITKKEKVLQSCIQSLYKFIGFDITLAELKKFAGDDYSNEIMYKLCLRYARKSCILDVNGDII